MDPSHAGHWALAIFLWFAASIVYRRLSGKQVFASARPDAVFVERWASGRAGTGAMARLSTARNCLQVQITAQELRLTPHFPFTLGFLPEIYGYDQAVRLDSIRSVNILAGRASKVVEVQYVDASKRVGVLQVLLRRGEAFVAALEPRIPATRTESPGEPPAPAA